MKTPLLFIADLPDLCMNAETRPTMLDIIIGLPPSHG